MKNPACVFLSLVFSLLFLASSGFAVEEMVEKPKEKHFYEIGYETYYYYYEEPNFMENEGWMNGLNLSYTYQNQLYAKAESRFAIGEVDYTSNGTGSSDDIRDWTMEYRLLGGYHFEGETWDLIFYTGFGYRYLNDDSSGTITTTGAAGYERESNYFYSPLGVDYFIDIGKNWELGLTSEFDFFWYGLQRSHLSDAVSGLGDIDNNQNSGFGFQSSVVLKYSTDNIDYTVEPFFRYWHIEDSDTQPITYGGVSVGYGLEPENNTVETGLKFSIIY